MRSPGPSRSRRAAWRGSRRGRRWSSTGRCSARRRCASRSSRLARAGDAGCARSRRATTRASATRAWCRHAAAAGTISSTPWCGRPSRTPRPRCTAGSCAPSAAAATPRRTREQDALALLDEGGVAMLCEAAAHGVLCAALDARDPTAIADLVAAGRALGVVYGHAVLEHLALEGPPVRALVHPIACAALPAAAPACVALADVGLAAALDDARSFIDAGEMRSLPVQANLLGGR
ncbi:MAG: DUF3025 domain-containing protein [Polyangiaceae bacterium]